MSTQKIYEITLSHAWKDALINNDFSGMERWLPDEVERVKSIIKERGNAISYHSPHLGWWEDKYQEIAEFVFPVIEEEKVIKLSGRLVTIDLEDEVIDKEDEEDE